MPDPVDSENEETIETLWTKYTKEEPNEFDNFIESGGDSFSAVVISEAFNDNDLIDILLNKTFQDVKSHIESKNLTLKHQLKIPRFSENQEAKNSEAAIFKIKWKQNLDKCIDASPLIIGDKIVIGSHSGLIAAFDLDVGKEAWKVQLDDRIEASANSNDSSIFVGTYSGSFYSLDFLTGMANVFLIINNLLIIWGVRVAQSMSPIANIEIAIPIFTKNCDRDPDPDRHFNNDRDPDFDHSFKIADLFSDLFNYWSYIYVFSSQI